MRWPASQLWHVDVAAYWAIINQPMAWWLSVGASVGWRVVLAGMVLAGLVVGPGLLVLLSHHGRAASDDAPRSRLQVLGATGKTSGTGGVDHLVCRSYVCWW